MHFRSFSTIALFYLLILTTSGCHQLPNKSALSQPPMEATQAQKPQVNRSNNWWQVRHDEKLIEAKNKNVDVLLLGDSITHGWEKGGRENIWQQYYPGLTHFNLGFSGDRTEHVLWRIQHGSVDHLQAKLTILMIGTNNTGHRMDPAKHTALGVKAIIDALQSKIPKYYC